MIRHDRAYQKGVEDGQDLLDLAIQEYGSIEMLFQILEDNTDVLSSVTAPIQAATLLEYRADVEVPKPEIQRWFREQKKHINTHNTETNDNLLLQENLDLLLQQNASGIIITPNSQNVQSTNNTAAAPVGYALQ